MNSITNTWAFLSGKKTYIIAALTILLGLLQGDQQMIATGFLALTLRHAISTAA